MARRRRTSLLGSALQRSFGALTRATLRAGSSAVRKATRDGTRAVLKATTQALQGRPATPARPRLPPAGQGAWSSGVAIGAGTARRYRLFEPARIGRAGPTALLVMLHGCSQDAAALARSTRLATLAARAGVLLLFPEQERLANPQGCWNWFETRSGRAEAEAASIVATIDEVCRLHGADPRRVAVGGFSAGAGMAALLGLRYPTRFAAVAMHSGVGPGVAHSTATALAAMQGRRRTAAWTSDTPLPPLLVIQGSADHVVAAANGRAAAQAWAAASGAVARPPRRVQRGKRRATIKTDYKRAGRVCVSLCEVEGLGHAWSGGATGQPYSDPDGPDASRLWWSFATRLCAQAA